MPAAQPRLVFHVLPPSHPCATVETALKLKGLDYEKVELQAGPHVEEMQQIYGEGRHTVPGLLVDDEPVHGSNAILERLEQLAPEPSLYPAGLAEAVRAAAQWATRSCRTSAVACRGVRCTSARRRWAPSPARARWI